jgi:hypothetical protein
MMESMTEPTMKSMLESVMVSREMTVTERMMVEITR